MGKLTESDHFVHFQLREKEKQVYIIPRFHVSYNISKNKRTVTTIKF